MRDSSLTTAITGLAVLLLCTTGISGAAEAKKIKGKDIARGAISAKHIKAGALTGAKIADGSLTSADIQDGSLTSDDVADEMMPAGIAYDNVRTNVALTNTEVTVETITLLAPVDGHILAAASGNAKCNGSCPVHSLVYGIKVTESDASVDNHGSLTNEVTANEWVRFSAVHAQSVVAGATTVELLARCVGPSTGGTMGPENLSALFVPNLYQ